MALGTLKKSDFLFPFCMQKSSESVPWADPLWEESQQ